MHCNCFACKSKINTGHCFLQVEEKLADISIDKDVRREGRRLESQQQGGVNCVLLISIKLQSASVRCT